MDLIVFTKTNSKSAVTSVEITVCGQETISLKSPSEAIQIKAIQGKPKLSYDLA